MMHIYEYQQHTATNKHIYNQDTHTLRKGAI